MVTLHPEDPRDIPALASLEEAAGPTGIFLTSGMV